MVIVRNAGNHALPFSVAILDLQLQFTKIADTTIEKFDSESMGVAAGISFLSVPEHEIPLGGGNSTNGIIRL